MKTFETLYARDSKGRINEWFAHAEISGLLSIEEGLIDGTKTLTTRLCKSKNVGKMNQTNPFEQACSEAESRWIKKKKQGYKSLTDLCITEVNDNVVLFNNVHWQKTDIQNVINEALPQVRTDNNNNLKPMKAQKYFKDNGEVRIKFPCLGQPKLNGFRCVARWEKVIIEQGTLYEQEKMKVVFRSKEGLSYDILDHIAEEFTEEMFKWNINGKEIELVFDGEMYIPREILSEISSAVRKRNPKTAILQFHIFDLAIPDLRNDERVQILNTMCTNRMFDQKHFIRILSTIEISSNEHAQMFTDDCISAGSEGAIFRAKSAQYAFGSRPMTMVKLKRSEDKEFLITDVVGGENAPDLGVFVCIQEQGLSFNCTPEGNHEHKREYLTNKHKYIGKKLTVRFFERTKDNKPFHAVGVAVRDYE